MSETLPTYERRLPRFDETFGVVAGPVIAAMDEAGDDSPSQAPAAPFPLKVSVRRTGVPVRILDPFGSGRMAVATCQVQAGAFLPSNRRGLHISRVGDAVARLASREFSSLEEYARALSCEIYRSEYGGYSTVRVLGSLPYVEEVRSRDSVKASLEHLHLRAYTRHESERPRHSAGLSVAHIVACPCVQQTYKHTLRQVRKPVEAPLLTHTQRCWMQIDLHDLTVALPVRDLLAALDGVLFRTQNTLPRDQELALVYRAHASPQFVEDATRQALVAVRNLLGGSQPQAAVSIRSRSVESIHDFDLFAEAVAPLSEEPSVCT